MEYNYHFTEKSKLDSIAAKGLIPMYGKNSKLVSTDDTKYIFFSEGLPNTIFFNCCYRNVLEQEKVGYLDSYLFDNIYLRFGDSAVSRTLSFCGYNNYTDKKIAAKYLEICALEDKKTKLLLANQEYFLLYLMSQISVEDMVRRTTDPNSEFCIQKLYTYMNDRLNSFNCEEHQLRYIPLREFVSDYEECEESRYIKK